MFTAALALVFLAVGALAQVTINTPTSIVVCQPVQITWSGGTPPYFLVIDALSSILPGNQPSAPALQDLGTLTGTTFSWLANLAAGTSIFFQIRDSTGALGQSAAVTIQTGSDTSCVGKTTSASSTSSASSNGTVSTTAATVGVTTTTAVTTHPSTTAPGTTLGSGSSTPRASTEAPAATTAPSSGAIKLASSGALALGGIAALAALL